MGFNSLPTRAQWSRLALNELFGGQVSVVGQAFAGAEGYASDSDVEQAGVEVEVQETVRQRRRMHAPDPFVCRVKE